MILWTDDGRHRRILMAAPRKPHPSEPWRSACLGLALIGLALSVGLYGLGVQNGRLDAMQRGQDADYYRQVAEECKTAFNDLAFDATYAANATLDASRWLRAAREYADGLRVPPTLLVAATGDPGTP